MFGMELLLGRAVILCRVVILSGAFISGKSTFWGMAAVFSGANILVGMAIFGVAAI